MKPEDIAIVVLDGSTLNPGDLDWAPLEALGRCTIYDRTEPDGVVQRMGDADAAITNKVAFDRATIMQLPRLQYIGVTATGYNVIDLDATAERGIVVTNVPTYGTASVAQMVFALLLELTQHVGEHSRAVREGKWSRCANFCFWDYPLIELEGLTLGIVGFGRIGRKVAALGGAFGMQVLAYDAVGSVLEDDGARAVALDELFSASDVVSLHCPLTPETERLVDADRLRTMKSSAFLVNTARGPIVDEPALADALAAGQLAGAALDVLETEPPAADNPLFAAPNCIITPHIAWATRAARQRLMDTTVANVKGFLEGAPRNVVR